VKIDLLIFGLRIVSIDMLERLTLSEIDLLFARWAAWENRKK
jgi:hypothetical protein